LLPALKYQDANQSIIVTSQVNPLHLTDSNEMKYEGLLGIALQSEINLLAVAHQQWLQLLLRVFLRLSFGAYFINELSLIA